MLGFAVSPSTPLESLNGGLGFAESSVQSAHEWILRGQEAESEQMGEEKVV